MSPTNGGANPNATTTTVMPVHGAIGADGGEGLVSKRYEARRAEMISREQDYARPAA